MQKNNVCFVVPIYRTEFTSHELISIKRLFKLFKNKKDIAIIVPRRITSELKEKLFLFGIEGIIVSFPDHYFASISGYNQLMLSKSFYKQFSNYEYIQISQLDTYIFRDEIDYWTSLGFDYIGAPWINFAFNKDENILQLIPFLQRFIIGHERLNNFFKIYKVGNGGFSLRKTKTFIETLELLEKSKFRHISLLVNEDIVWSLIGPRVNKHFKIPGYQTALKYAFEVHAELCFKLNNKKLPFGCHAWEKHAPDFWLQFIEDSEIID